MKSAFFAVMFFCTGALAQSVMLPGPGLGVTPPSGNSLIFTAASSQYLTATGKTGMNQQKMTFSLWNKLTTASITQVLYEFRDVAGMNFVQLFYNGNNTFQVRIVTGTVTVMNLTTTATYTDTSNWHHILLGLDTTQAVSTNRAILYYDGTLVSVFNSTTYPVQNSSFAFNVAVPFYIGQSGGSATYLNAKLAQVYYIDGQQLTPASIHHRNAGRPHDL